MEGKVFATIGAGRIGYRILERLVAFNPKKLLYYDYQPLPEEAINKLNVASKLFNGVDNIVERVENWKIWFLKLMLLLLIVHYMKVLKGYSIKI